jgi:hypothetical protein
MAIRLIQEVMRGALVESARRGAVSQVGHGRR